MQDPLNIYELLNLGKNLNARDIHILNKEASFRIKKDIQKKVKTLSTSNILQDLQLEFKNEVSYSLSINIDNVILRVRITCYLAFSTEDSKALSIRIFFLSPPSLDMLKAPSVLKDICKLQSGLILVCGATSSGKSSTCASLLDYINESRNAHIVCIEDPIEYIHKDKNSRFTQREISTHTPSFNLALSSCLRQDVDIIFIGEILDKEVLKMAINLSLSGHLVISTFHSMDCVSAISRILSYFEDEALSIRTNLSACLSAIISQYLFIKEDELLADFEVLIATPAIRSLIKDNKINQISSQIAMGKEFGMCCFKHSLQP